MSKDNYSWYSLESTKPLAELKDYDLPDKYRADNKGNVFIHNTDVENKENKFYGKKMSAYVNRDGYVEYVVSDKNNNKKHLLSHRVVALLFIPNPNNHPHVGHKDDDKENCKESNLEWTTISDNIEKTYKNGRIPWNKGKRIKSRK